MARIRVQERGRGGKEKQLWFIHRAVCFSAIEGLFTFFYFSHWFRWKYIFPTRKVLIMIFISIIYRCDQHTEPVMFLMRGIPPYGIQKKYALISAPMFSSPKNWSPHSEGWRSIQKIQTCLSTRVISRARETRQRWLRDDRTQNGIGVRF